jgi:hypothetical protein
VVGWGVGIGWDFCGIGCMVVERIVVGCGLKD